MLRLEGIKVKIKWAVLVLLVSLITLPRAEAKAPGLNTESIPNWRDVYVFATSTHYEIPKLKPTPNGQCVEFIKVNGFEGYRGNAQEWAKYINTDKPSIGDVVVLNEGRWGHLALITGFDTGIIVTEQNYKGLYIVSTRSIEWNYKGIVGFITK